MIKIFSRFSLVLTVSFLAISPVSFAKKNAIKEAGAKDEFELFNEDKKPLQPGNNDNKYFLEANRLIKEKKPDQAINYLWTNIEYLSRKSLLLLSELHRVKGDFQKESRVASLLISKNEKDFEALYYLGDAQLNIGKVNEGIETLNKAIELNPKYEPSYLSLIQHYEKKKNKYELRVIYEDLVKNIGPRAIYLSKLCQINKDDNLAEAGRTYCEKAIIADKNNPLNQVNLGLILIILGEDEKAGKLLKNTAIKFTTSEDAQVEYADFLFKKKNFTEAFGYYNKALKLNSKNLKALTGSAESGIQLLKNDIAYDNLKKACFISNASSVSARRIVIELRKLGADNSTVNKFENLSFTCSQK